MLVPDPPAPGPRCAQLSTGCCTVAHTCTLYSQALLAAAIHKREHSTAAHRPWHLDHVCMHVMHGVIRCS